MLKNLRNTTCKPIKKQFDRRIILLKCFKIIFCSIQSDVETQMHNAQANMKAYEGKTMFKVKGRPYSRCCMEIDSTIIVCYVQRFHMIGFNTNFSSLSFTSLLQHVIFQMHYAPNKTSFCNVHVLQWLFLMTFCCFGRSS